MATGPTSRNDPHDAPEQAKRNDEPELRFRAVFENALDAMLLADDEGRIVDANTAAEELFGLDRSQLLARTSIDLMRASGSGEAKGLWNTFRKRGSQRGELQVRRADGTTRQVEYVATTQVLPGRHLSVLRDVTDRRRDEASLRFLAEASTVLASSLDYETTLRSVARMAVPAVADWAVIDVARADGSLQRVAIAHVDQGKVEVANRVEQRIPLRADDPFGPGKVIRTGEPEVNYEVTDAHLDATVPNEELREVIRSLGLRSSMCVPLRTRGRIVGALSLAFSESDRRYEARDLALAEELARRCAIGLENAHLYGAAEAARAAADAATKRAELLSEASRVLATMRDCDAMLETASRMVVPELCDWCFADRIDEDGVIRRAAVVHARPEDAGLAARIGLQSARSVAQLGRIGVLVDETPQIFTQIDDAFLQALARDAEHLEALRELAPRAVIVLPLAARGRILGSLALVRSRDPRPFLPEEIDLAEELARRVAIAVDNAQLQHATEAAEQRARFLADASVALASSLDDEATLPNVTRLLVPRMADMAAAYVLAPDGAIRPVAVAHVDSEIEPLVWELHTLAPVQFDQERPLSAVIRTGRSVLVPEMSSGLRELWGTGLRVEELLATIAMRSAIIVPIELRGRVLGAIALASSASGRRFGAADRAVAEELARRVATALENAQLYRDAREASRLKDEFLATISHELRTPLNAILGWATILPTRLDSPEAIRRGLEVIERNARAQARVIDDVLDVSRIVSGKLRLQRESVDLATVLRAAVESIGASASAANIDLAIDLAPDLGQLDADADRLRQIVWNVLSNAVKFTPSGGHVRVSARRSPERVVIEVEDDGVGIDPEFLPYVFDRFRQADSSMTRRHGGLGLGLAIARDLTELHGGTIHVESAGRARGARFRIVLPVHGAPGGSELAAAATPEPLAESATPLDGVRVLVCDDDADSRELMVDLLRGAGAEVESSGSASEALDAIARRPPDVLISDIAMPGEDGYALIRRVRARPPESGGNVPAVALTAYAGAAERRRALEAGFHQHVAKPVDPADLLVVVANLAGRFAAV